MSYERRGTAPVPYSINPRALHTNMFGGRHILFTHPDDGFLFAGIQWGPEAGIIKGSDNEGFDWATTMPHSWAGSRTEITTGINGPATGCYTIGSYWFYMLTAEYTASTSSYTIWAASSNKSQDDGYDAFEDVLFLDETKSNGMFTTCENHEFAFFIFTYLWDGSYTIFLKTINGLSFGSSQIFSTTDNYEDIFDATASYEKVHIAALNSNDGSSAPTIDYICYDLVLERYNAPVVVDTLPSTSHYACDLVIARDGYETLCMVWGEMDAYPGSSTVAWRYAISTDDGLTWTVTDMTFETGYSAYKDAINAECVIRADVLGGSNGGFIITYTQNDDSRTGVAQGEEITCEADTSGSLNNKYWWLFTEDTSYYVWYNVSSGGTDPTPSAPSGGPSTTSGIEVAISTDDTASSVASATQTAIDAEADFTSVVSGAVIAVAHNDAGVVKDAEDDATAGTGWTDAWLVARLGKGTPRSFVRRLTTTDGSTYTLSDESDATNTPSTWNIAGAKFFYTAKGKLPNLDVPGNVRIAYQIEEGGNKEQDVGTRLYIDQDVLAVGPYPTAYPSDDGSYTVETAGADELLVTFEIVDATSNNIDFYDQGYTGEYTTSYMDAFSEYGTSVRILKYAPASTSQKGDADAYSAPEETWANIFIDPLSYRSPDRVENADNTIDYVEQDIRKVYLPPDLHLSREFILNDGNYLKRTVWILVYAGNKYELTQVVPRLIDNQITHYECNAYVVGPSYNPFTRVALPSET